MRTIVLTSILIASTSPILIAQEKLVGAEFEAYYDWFNEQSPTENLYTNGALLYVFGKETAARIGPCASSEIIDLLQVGQSVYNIVTDEFYFPEDKINGYEDIWYHVRWRGTSGKNQYGYIWGADIAKSWTQEDLNGDDNKELLLLGVSSKERKTPKDINAEIKILNSNKTVYQITVPGLCVFEECASSSMIRVLNENPKNGLTIVEASTMTMGCWAGIEKSFFFWNGASLERVYQAEFTTQTQFAKKEFVVSSETENGINVKMCSYSHEDEKYNPVWTCKMIKSATSTPAESITADASIVRAP